MAGLISKLFLFLCLCLCAVGSTQGDQLFQQPSSDAFFGLTNIITPAWCMFQTPQVIVAFSSGLPTASVAPSETEVLKTEVSRNSAQLPSPFLVLAANSFRASKTCLRYVARPRSETQSPLQLRLEIEGRVAGTCPRAAMPVSNGVVSNLAVHSL
jgi:hypothetical protein